MAIFVSLIGYLIYYNGVKSEDFINSPYNTRQDTFSDRVIRGKIMSSDGEVLAQTNVYDDGTEERVYPYSNIFAHVVGFDSNGKSGLESEANFSLLSSHQFFVDQMKNEFLDRKNMGDTVISTLDASLQAAAYNALGDRRGAVVVMEPSTGKILAEVSTPDFDPNSIAQEWDYLVNDANNSCLLNRATNGAYPPGSTFKTTQGLTFASEGIISPAHTAFPCSHGFNFKGLHVGCHGHASPLSLVPALSTSCNAYFCWGLYYMMGAKSKYGSVQNAMNRWRDYMVSMGFGYRLGIDLPGEKRGLIPNADFYDNAYRGSWNGLTIISISIGQGEVNATPLQIANLGATIANRGYFYVPHVVRKVQDEPLDTLYRRRHYTMAKRQAYDYVVAGMRSSAVGGTCRELSRYDINACGKTGTAQNRGHDHSVFMGFAPMDNPKIAVAVYVENGGWGATYGVPIGGLIMEQYIHGKLSEASMKRAEEFQHRHIAYGNIGR